MADGAIFHNAVEHVCFRIRSVVRLRHPELDAAAILNKEAPACGSGRKCTNSWGRTGATPSSERISGRLRANF